MKQAIAIIALCCAASTSFAAADLSGNIGFNSNYIFRGVEQSTSSANAGLDIEQDGIYLGAWAASVDPGLEVDLYGGYRGSLEEFDYGIGATGYFYTDDFDDTYYELNLEGGWKIFNVEAAFGRYKNFNGPTQDYIFLAGGAEVDNFYGVIGGYLQDFEGMYLELGYGDTLNVADTDLFDWSISIVFRGDDLPTNGSEDDTYLNLGFTKSFDINLRN